VAAPLIVAESVGLEYPTRVVFDGVTVGVAEGDRIGIVGVNGDGKSTLLRILAGSIPPDEGRVILRRALRIGVVGQRDDLDPAATVAETIVGDRSEHEWAGDPKVRDVIGGLVADVAWEASVAELSGGQRRRVALAAVLVDDWDVIALDEPTNHLDIEGITWLATHLQQRWPPNAGAVVVITHDRWFLDEVCTATWEVHDATVDAFEGGYAAYVLQRVMRDRIAAATEAKRQNLLRKELAWLRRGAPARTRKPKFRIEAANALIADVPPVRNPVELQRLAVARLGKDVVDLEDVSVRYGDRDVLQRVTWRLAPGERTGIVGANGSGKSTLLGLIAGTVTPTTGLVKRGRTVRVGLLDQQFARLAAIGDRRVREVLAEVKATFEVDGRNMTPSQLLERLGFSKRHLSSFVRELSGGQKRRLQLLLALLDQPNVILLDEPTNDVDADMLAATEDLLDSWPGTLVVVSHDRYLLERVTDQQYAILDGRLRHLPGGVDEYLELRRRTAPAGSLPGPAAAATERDRGRSYTGLSGAERRQIQKEVSSIERRMAKRTTQVHDLHQRMATHDHTDHVGMRRLDEQLRAIESETVELEERWLELSERLEG